MFSKSFILCKDNCNIEFCRKILTCLTLGITERMDLSLSHPKVLAVISYLCRVCHFSEIIQC